MFELQINPTSSPLYSDVVLNGHTLDLAWSDLYSNTSGSLLVNSTSGNEHAIEYDLWSRLSSPSQPLDAEDVKQKFHFHGLSIDSVFLEGFGFKFESQPSSTLRLRKLSHKSASGFVTKKIDFRKFVEPFMLGEAVNTPQDDAMMSSTHDASFDLADEVEFLRLLETEAKSLQAQISAKKQAISNHLREDRDHVPLRHLLQECDGLICAARVIAQRICDKVGVVTEPSFGYAKAQNPRLQHTIDSYDKSERPQQNSRNCTKSRLFAQGQKVPSKHANGTAHRVNVPLLLTKNATTTEYRLIDLVDPPNPLVRALQVIAAVLGLAALCTFIRRKCMSMRRRVERAADREERRNARAYRKAARRAEMRRRWDNFVSAVNCFRSAPEPRMEDYEEKRALILQDAFLDQLGDLDQAEKGEIMEAEIRELRYAHEIVASLVRADEHRYDLVTPINDPPPPLVPLPYTPETRSRASTNTLPSYTSESLPDYSSRPETLAGSSTRGSVANGFTHYTPSTSDDGSLVTRQSTSSGGRMRYTPTSSILEMSPRVSEETLRTRQSKDTHEL